MIYAKILYVEKVSPNPSDIEAKMHQPRVLQMLDSGEHYADLGGESLQLKDCDCEQLGNPEARCNEIYEYELPADAIERANLGFDLDELPSFIGVKGGAARQVLEALVHSDRQLPPPRDVDLVILEEVIASGDYDPDEIWAVASNLSMRFSPRDAMNGYGAEPVHSTAEFMRQHDFTINQVLIHKDGDTWRLLASTQAVLDTAEHVIRPTVFEHDPDNSYRIGNKLALKAVRLLSDMQVQGIDDASIKSVQLPDDTYGDPRDDYFMQTLQLDKALEVSDELAECYVENLRSYRMLPYGCEDMSAAELYYELVNRTNFVPSDGNASGVFLTERENRLELGSVAKFNDAVERLLQQVPEQFSRDYYDSKK